jgi:hypothetical protein
MESQASPTPLSFRLIKIGRPHLILFFVDFWALFLFWELFLKVLTYPPHHIPFPEASPHEKDAMLSS